MAASAKEIEIVLGVIPTCAVSANLARSGALASTLGDPWLAGAGGPKVKVEILVEKRKGERTSSPFLLLASSWAPLFCFSPYSAAFRLAKYKGTPGQIDPVDSIVRYETIKFKVIPVGT